MRQGGRRSGLARELRERAIAERRSVTSGPDVDALPESDVMRLTRRQAVVAAGALGGALMVGRTGSARAAGGRRSPHDARVVIVGAGLAGVTAAYQLHRVGVPAQVYEARDRIGGRCWTARGFAEGQVAEHGGEFIDSRHVHIRQLARQLGLELDDLFAARYGSFSPTLVGDSFLRDAEIRPVMRRVAAAAEADARMLGVLRPDGTVNTAPISFPTATPQARRFDHHSMSEWLERRVPSVLHSRVGRWLDEAMGSWYGLNMDQLSAINWIDYYVIPYPGGDERWHVRGGNDQVPHRAAATLPADAIRLEAALRSVRRLGGGYELTFDGAEPVRADLVILTLPFTTLRDVDLAGAELSAHKLAAIRELAMGDDSKLLVQYDRRPWRMHDWSATVVSADPDWDTWESSAMEPGHAGLITVYAGGRTAREWRAPTPHGPAPAPLRHSVLERIDQAVPGSLGHFNGRAWADLWPHDPWTRGSYAAFGPGQYTRFWQGTARAEDGIHFAGEATSTYSQGFLNGGVESGDRTAIEVMRKLRIPVPPGLARLPYSPA